MNKNYSLYIAIAACLLIAIQVAGVNAEETIPSGEKAIESAKKCVIHFEGREMTAEEAMATLGEIPGIVSVGWVSVDVSEAEYFVAFKYRLFDINRLWAFHVTSQDNTAEWIEPGEDFLGGDRYISRVISTSTYPKKVLEEKVRKVLEHLMFQ